MSREIEVNVMRATERIDQTTGKTWLIADIKIDDVEFQIHTDQPIKTIDELVDLAVEEYKKTYREELMGERKRVI